AKVEDLQGWRRRHGLSVESDNMKWMARQSELDVFGRARVQKMEENALAFFHSHRLSVPKTLAIDRKPLIADFPSVRFFLLLLRLLCFARCFRVNFVSCLHLFGSKKRLEFVGCQE